MLADRLADACSVVLFDAPGPPASASSRSLGIAACGGMDSPARLKLALGEAAEGIWRWSAGGIQDLFATAERLGVSPTRGGSWRVSHGPEEWREWETSRQLLNRWGFDSRTVADPRDEGLGQGFDGCVWVGGDGQLDVAALLGALRERLVGRVEVRPRPAGIVRTLGRVHLDADVDAEIAVVAAGQGASSAHPWFGPMVIPVRLQGLRVPGVSLPGPALARHRFEAWSSDAAGLSLVGCRWAEQPEMEAGVTDDQTVSEAVEARAREFLGVHHPDVPLEAASSWSGIAAFSCDGLPLVGAIPGEPRVQALTGWGGWGLSWVGAAVRDVAGSILGTSDPDAIPAMLRPRRMV